MLQRPVQQVRRRSDTERLHVQVSCGDVVAGPNRLLESDDLVETAVGVEGSLNVGERMNRAIGTSTTVHAISAVSLAGWTECTYAN